MFQATDKGIVNEINPIEKMDIKAESEEVFVMNDEEIGNEMNPVEKTDIKAESEEFCHLIDDQGNYDGVMWMIIFADLLRTFCCCFYVSFSVDMFSYSIKYTSLY